MFVFSIQNKIVFSMLHLCSVEIITNTEATPTDFKNLQVSSKPKG